MPRAGASLKSCNMYGKNLIYIGVISNVYCCMAIYRKNGFIEISKNLAKHKSENNFVWIIKIIM